MKCRICGDDRGETYNIREMMYGSKTAFPYFKCGQCGCLEIIDIPRDIGNYYPADYYSFSPRNNGDSQGLRKKMKPFLMNFYLFTAGKRFLRYKAPYFLSWVVNGKANLDSKILDAGCGAGNLLHYMATWGYKNLTGIDLYVDKPVIDTRIKIYKSDIYTIQETYDFIMFNHSFEHMDKQLEVLSRASGLLNKNGTIMIRIPVLSKYIWDMYNVNWVQIDAPRHYYLHTEESFKLLSDQAGLQIYRKEYDSTEFQFWGSEQIKDGIPLFDKRSYGINPRLSPFTDDDIQKFRILARKLNKEYNGDMACFFLKKREG